MYICSHTKSKFKRIVVLLLTLIISASNSLPLTYAHMTADPNTSTKQPKKERSGNKQKDLAPPDTVLSQLAPIKKSQSTSTSLTPEAQEMANLIEVSKDLQEIERLKVNLKPDSSPSSTKNSQEEIKHELDHLTTEVSKKVLKASLEADYAMSEIALQQGRDEYLLSLLQSKQDKHLLWANRLDAISNAVLWGLSSALSINSYKNARLSIPAGTTGVLAGTIPPALELGTLQLPIRERLKYKAHVNMLSIVFDEDAEKDFYLPPSVNKFIENPDLAHDGTLTRKAFLLKSWQDSSLTPKPKSRGYDKWVRMVTGTSEDYEHLTSQVLQNRIMMLHHLQITVFSMKRGLLELMQVL